MKDVFGKSRVLVHVTLQKIILGCSPDITEKISWGMATFVLNGNLVHFSGEKKHIDMRPHNRGRNFFVIFIVKDTSWL